jgi:16S rRNA (guanine966-N2)-methyltransferase
MGYSTTVDAGDGRLGLHATSLPHVRVVAGRARGRPLHAPRGGVTRPTSDRVREAVFDMLGSLDAVEGAAALDLFAGSGAYGIESLSRGAESAVLVDRDADAVAAIRRNLEVLGDDAGRATVVRMDALSYAAGAPEMDLVFADPPYDFTGWPELLARLAPRTGLLVAETGWVGAGAPWSPGPGWETVKVKRYGATVVSIVVPERVL